MSGHVYVGMSGFSYPEWVGDFYPPGTKRDAFLAHYATRLSAVEINMTFRRMPAPTTLEKWQDAVWTGFRFALKAHQRITHHKRLVDVSEDVDDFVRLASGLGGHLGPILFQTPPNLAFDAGVLDDFLGALPPGARYAFEPRHVSFGEPQATDLLTRHGVGWCLNDDVFSIDDYRITGPVAYLRLRRDDYSAQAMETLATSLRGLATDADETYAFFKHEDDPSSIRAAIALAGRFA